uniref:HTH CENPB-type domain-containing protein n=1 Tax=Glossina austeni TaxID=7395 RepID=A0A1A9USL2_GLOAU
MSTKKNEKRVSTRKKSVLPLKVKIEMLDRLRLGESFSSISRSFNVNESTVRSIRKSEGKITSSVASISLSAKIVRDPAIEKMEVALSLWIEDRNQKRVPLSGPMVREKANRLYAHFKGPDGSCSGECTDGGFQASEGWFNKFKVRQSLHNIEIVGEAESADTAATERYPEEFANLVADEGYKPEQVKQTEIANGIGQDGFEQIESSDIQVLLEPQDDLNETGLEEMLNSQPIEEEGSTSTENVTFNLKNYSDGLRMANELRDFFMNIDPSTERSLTFKRQIADASESKKLLKTAKQEKITKFFKPLPKP